MALADRRDPHLSCNFAVQINEQIVAGFSEVSGLDFESAVETFREGGVIGYEQQLPGPLKFPSRIVLKRGFTNNTELWSWYQDVMRGRVIRKDVSVVLLDGEGQAQRRWSFRRAVPVKWVGPQLRGSASEVAVETLELIHQGFIDKGLDKERVLKQVRELRQNRS